MIHKCMIMYLYRIIFNKHNHNTTIPFLKINNNFLNHETEYEFPQLSHNVFYIITEINITPCNGCYVFYDS